MVGGLIWLTWQSLRAAGDRRRLWLPETTAPVVLIEVTAFSGNLHLRLAAQSLQRVADGRNRGPARFHGAHPEIGIVAGAAPQRPTSSGRRDAYDGRYEQKPSVLI